MMATLIFVLHFNRKSAKDNY